MDRVKSNIPFVGLHAHSVAGSPFDGFGYPQDHMDFAYQNGCDALALTDHGNANGLSYQVLHAQKMQKEGKDFKPIFGELYTKKRNRIRRPEGQARKQMLAFQRKQMEKASKRPRVSLIKGDTWSCLPRTKLA